MLRPLLNVAYASMVAIGGQAKADELFTDTVPTFEVPEQRSRRGRRALSPAEQEARREFMRSFG